MVQLGNWHKIILIFWTCPVFLSSNFKLDLVGVNKEFLEINW